MKKLCCIVLTALLVLSLAACGKATPQEDSKSVDLKQAAEDAIASLGDEVVLFPVEDTAEIESLYPGLTAVETKQLVAYQPPVSGYGCELVMVEVANSADTETVRSILQQRVDNAANDSTYPENAPAWKNNAAVTVNGNYVVMGVLPEGMTLPDAFKAVF